MPYVMRKLPKQDLYRVYNAKTKEVHSYGTTLENAKKQITLLNMVDAGVPLQPLRKVAPNKRMKRVEVSGGAIKIDKETTGVLRVDLTNAAKNWLENKVLPLITQTTIRINDTRKNSGVGRTQVFGYGRRRQLGFGEFKNNSDHPELWRALAIFGSKVVPNYIPWSAIQVNHNYKTKKHIDGNNIGLSLAVSFGDFTGGELVIGTNEYQTKLHPVIFNGALTEHFNKPIKGNRYSLVYFVSAPKNATDEDIFKLHKDLIEKVKKMEKSGGALEPFVVGGGVETDDFFGQGKVSIPEFSNIALTLPTYMFKKNPVTKKGKQPKYKYKLVVPTTKARYIATRDDGIPAVSILRKPVAKPIGDLPESKETPNRSDFSPADQDKIDKYYEDVRRNEKKKPESIASQRPNNKTRGRPVFLAKNAEFEPNTDLKFDPSTKTYGVNPKIPTPETAKGKRGRPKKQVLPPSAPLTTEAISSRASSRTPSKASSKKSGIKEIILKDEDIVFPDGSKSELSSLPSLAKDSSVSSKSSRRPKSVASSESSISTAKFSESTRSSKSSKSSKKSEKSLSPDEIAGAEELADIDIDDFFNDLLKEGKGIKNKISNKSIGMNSWIQHCKNFAAKKGIKYNEALKDPECKATYKKGEGLVSDLKSATRKVGFGIIDEAAAKGYADQVLIADAYNQKNLGAQKRYISL